MNELGSDHLPIKITLSGAIKKEVDRTPLNYEGANWQQFRKDVQKQTELENLETADQIENTVNKITINIQ
jgi:hypothetical protein